MSVNVEGTVSYLSGARVKDAVIKASPLDNQPVVQPTVTDDDGDFTLALEPGQWEIFALHNQGVTDAQKLTVANVPVTGIKFQLRAFDEHDQRIGWRFFLGTVGGLLLLVILYALLHVAFPPTQEPLDNTLKTLITTTRSQIAATESVTATGAVLVSRLNALAEDERLSREDQSDIADRSRRLETLLESDNLSDLDSQLDELERLLASIVPPQSFFWHAEPARFLEILFGALAGILVSKIISTGYYLYQKRFYAAGVYMHLSHLVTVPILAIITTILLSQATLQLTLSDANTITVDFTNPEWALVISFLVSVNPWPLWGFVQRAADRFLGRQNAAQSSP